MPTPSIGARTRLFSPKRAPNPAPWSRPSLRERPLLCSVFAFALSACTAPVLEVDGGPPDGLPDSGTETMDAGIDAGMETPDGGSEESDAGPTADPDTGPIPDPDAGPIAPSDWSRGFGGVGNEGPMDVAIDSAGNVYVLGTFSGPFNAGDGLLPHVGDVDIFLVSYDPTGALRWQQTFASTGSSVGEFGVGIAIDSADRIYILGQSSDPFDLGGTELLPNSSSSGAFVASYDQNGAFLWQTLIDTPREDEPAAIAVDDQGVYLTASTRGSLNIGGNAHTNRGDHDIFLVKLDLEGTPQWSRQFGGDAVDRPTSLALGPDGHVYLAGFAESAIFSADGCIPTPCDERARQAPIESLVISFTSEGAHRWTHLVGSDNLDDGSASALDIAVSDAVYYVGHFDNTMQFTDVPEDSITSVGGEDGFVAKLSLNGGYEWAINIGSNAYDRVETIVTTSDSPQRLVIGGHLNGELTMPDDFVGVSSGTVDQDDIFTAVLWASSGRTAGQPLDTIDVYAGDGDDDGVIGMAITDANVLVVGGHMNGTITIGDDMRRGRGARDLFVFQRVLP